MEMNLSWKKFIQDKIKENNDVFQTHIEFEQLIQNIVSHPQSMLLNLRYIIKYIRTGDPFHTYQFGSKSYEKIDYKKTIKLKDNRNSLCTIMYWCKFGKRTTINGLEKTLEDLFESFWKSPLRTLSAGMLDLKRDKQVHTIANNTLKLYREKKITCSLLFCDIDNFRKINDTLGHDYGDQAILEISSIIEFMTRKIGVPLHRGGDEFVILLLNGGMRKAKVLAANINHEIGKYEFRKAEYKFSFSISVGIASTEFGENVSFHNMLKKADEDLRDKKRRKRVQNV
jgi:diguanylate cyclase (GGDEF)-like protein